MPLSLFHDLPTSNIILHYEHEVTSSTSTDITYHSWDYAMIQCSHAYTFMSYGFYGGRPCNPYIFHECSGARLPVFGECVSLCYIYPYIQFLQFLQSVTRIRVQDLIEFGIPSQLSSQIQKAESRSHVQYACRFAIDARGTALDDCSGFVIHQASRAWDNGVWATRNTSNVKFLYERRYPERALLST